jgi:hypothetical protein
MIRIRFDPERATFSGVIRVPVNFLQEMIVINIFVQWKRINHKQSARWQYLSLLKASAFLIDHLVVDRSLFGFK